ncbi:tetratricopeptide repeat protein [Plesiomonas sp.]|uniref:tetratricopeptide repeat protein n=1 Tax=Plesiomonas sp. TaxID=2486279 RepID=UPI003F40E954
MIAIRCLLAFSLYFMQFSLAYAIVLTEIPFENPDKSLLDAEQLLKTQPKVAIARINQFLNKPNSNLSTSTTVRNLNTQYLKQHQQNILYSCLLKSRAFAKLGDSKQAMNIINNVIIRTKNQQHDLVYVDARLTKAELIWQLTHDKEQALDELQALVVQPDLLDSTTDASVRYHLLKVKIALNDTLLRSPSHDDLQYAKNELLSAQKLLPVMKYPSSRIHYYLIASQLQLLEQERDLAQESLITALSLAMEFDQPDLLASAQLQLAQFYFSFGSYSLALNYANQSAHFYQAVQDKANLATLLKLIGHIHRMENRLNLALVNYLNAMDIENSLPNGSKLTGIKIGIGYIYLNTHEPFKAAEYIKQVEQNLTEDKNSQELYPAFLLLKGDWLLHSGNIESALNLINKAIAKVPESELSTRLYAYGLLANAYKKKGLYKQENIYLHKKITLLHQIQKQHLVLNTETLEQREKLVTKINTEQLLNANFHAINAQREDTQKFNRVLLCIILVLLGVTCYFLILTPALRTALKRVRKSHYLHPRSGLPNQRCMSARLPKQLQHTLTLCEQAIATQASVTSNSTEQLADPFAKLRLNVAFIHVHWLSELSQKIEIGFTESSKIEAELGQYLQRTLGDNTTNKSGQIFQVRDGTFLYIQQQHSEQGNSVPEEFCASILSVFKQFSGYKASDGSISIGACQYPFLPRATSGVNLPQLLNILQLALCSAKDLNLRSERDNWVFLIPIQRATPACFQGNLHTACIEAIRRGLVKVLHSQPEYSIDWSAVEHIKPQVYPEKKTNTADTIA